MDSVLQNKNTLSSLLSATQSIGIVVSENQNIDVLGAALSLHLVFQDSGKSSQVIAPREPTVEQSFLVGIDQLAKSFGGVTKMLTVSFPYHDGDIEKVSYNIEGDRLNVNLFAEEQGVRFEEKDIKYIRQGTSAQLIFTIGVSNLSEVQGLIDTNASKIVNIDNSVSNSLYGDVVIVDASYSSISEIIARLTSDLGLQVEFDVAQNLLDGISFATNNFSSPKTSPVAFEMAGFLMQKGAVRKNIKEARPASSDTSLNMLGKNNQNKPFDSSSTPLTAGTQGKQFQKGQFGGQKFPKQQFGNQNQNRQSQQTQTVREEFVSNQPSQPRPIKDIRQTPAPSAMPTPQNEDISQPVALPEVPSEDEAPTDWFVPKVFKSNKN